MKQRGLTLVFIALLGALLHTAAVDGEFQFFIAKFILPMTNL
jgi:hypothetical protein